MMNRKIIPIALLFLCSLLCNCKNKDRNASGDTGKNEDTTAIAEMPEKDTMKTVGQMDTNEIQQTNITNDTILTIEDRIKAETHQVTEALKTNADAYKIVTKENYTITWDTIDTGMYYANMLPPVRSKIGESYIDVIKINPHYYSVELKSIREEGKSTANPTAKEWAEKWNFLVTANAGMGTPMGYNTGFMRDSGYVNKSKMTPNYNTVAAFNRKDTSVPAFQIIDIKNQNWDVLKNKYHSLFQGIRMIDQHRNNCWSKQKKIWSMVCIAQDKHNNILLIFTRSPYTVHDFIDILLDSPLNIQKAQYLEGGPEASLYVNHKGFEMEKLGSYETSYNENDLNDYGWGIFNVIGVLKKP